MKQMIIAVATVAALSVYAVSSFADPGGFLPPSGGSNVPSMFGQMGGPGTLIGAGDLPPGRGPDLYGLHPCLKKLFHRGGNCASNAPPPNPKNPLQNPANYAPGGYGMGGPAYNGPGGFPPTAPGQPNPYGPYGPVMQGTLVFPNQPFIRSPRDYFMVDTNK
jgi:hypothetical protein